MFDQLSESGAWVPGFWRPEVGNILEVGVRRGRHDTGFRDSTLADLVLLPIQTDSETDRHPWSATTCLAARYRLTLYDAAYLELALREICPWPHSILTCAPQRGLRILNCWASEPPRVQMPLRRMSEIESCY